MSSTKRGWAAAATLSALILGAQLIPATAAADPADPAVQPQPDPSAEGETPPPVPAGDLRNITYRARVDGVARGASISYKAENDQMMTADPTMLPGRTFEANTVLPVTQSATMQVSIDWPYSANLHCEILVDGQVASQADDFIGPKLTRAQDDPGYGTLSCEAPVGGVPEAAPVEGAPPVDGGAPAPPADAVPPPPE